MRKFTPLDLSVLYNLSTATLAAEGPSARPWRAALVARLDSLPAGPQTCWGIPFSLGPAGGARWIEIRGHDRVSVPMAGRASYVAVAHFCNASMDDEDQRQWPDYREGTVTRLGEHLADYVLVYADGTEHRQPIRRRFEVNEPLSWQRPFAARPHAAHRVADWRGPHPCRAWGRDQTGVESLPGGDKYWIYTLPNPRPEEELAALRLEGTGADRLAIAGLTLYHGQEDPLQHRRLHAFRVILPDQEAALPEAVGAEVDLGIITRCYAVPAFDAGAWLAADLQGWGEQQEEPRPTSDLRLDITASPGATLTINDHAVELAPVYARGAGASHDGAARIELVSGERTWVHVAVEDATTGRPVPVRVHFRSPDGRYLPPYGHRHEVNDNWFEDYGADLKLGSTEYAYVDGRFQIELPVGEVYVEAAKGFEYRPLRQKLAIRPGQRELTLRLERPLDWRARGWVTADTHVHFLSPQTAWLEAQAEGLNLVNLLASQWGDLYTNVGDITGDLSGVSRTDTLVWVGTENRQHIMGHISLLGVRGEPVYPMTTDGPGESYFGDPIESSLAEWADRCREREGVVVIPHFPDPHLEVAADVILGKVDGVEIRSFTPTIDNYRMREWYRFLNLGYRVAAVGGTDKMSAGMPVGGVRTYAHLGDEEFSLANWGKAVRAGRTFTTSGPLIGLSVEGRAPGDEIQLPAGGGTLAVEAWADSMVPIHEMQLVVNGRVVERVTAEEGTRRLQMSRQVRLDGSAWVAARCISRLQVWHSSPVNVAAHTSPVYVVAGGQELFNPSDAAFMLTLLDGGLTYLDKLSIPASREKHERIKDVFRRAQAEVHGRMHAHDVCLGGKR